MPNEVDASTRNIGLASLGGLLDFYDYVVFVFFTDVIGQVFFPSAQPVWLKQTEVFGLFAAGYIARPVGGMLIAHFGDRDGRKAMFVFSMLLMAAATTAIGLVPSYAAAGPAAPMALLLCRLLQGAAMGGEAPGGWVFAHEHARKGRMGAACGLLTSALCGGILLGSLAAATVNATLTRPEVLSFGWRLPFIGGGVAAALVATTRRRLDETPVFSAASDALPTARPFPLRQLLRIAPRTVLLSMLATWQLTAAVVVMVLMAPTLTFQGRAADVSAMLAANVAAASTLTLSAVAAGFAIDRFGAVAVAHAYAAAVIAAAYLLFGGAATHPAGGALVALHAAAGGAVGMTVVVPFAIVRAFRPQVRFSGVALSYNASYAIAGGLTPPLVAYLAHRDAFAPAHYLAAVTVVGAAAVVTLERSTRRDRPQAAPPRGAERQFAAATSSTGST